MRYLIFLLLSIQFIFVDCHSSKTEAVYLPEVLPTEESIKITLSSDSSLAAIKNKAVEMNKSLEVWKDEEKRNVSDSEIQIYWKSNRGKLNPEIMDTDAIDRIRDSIRVRLAWSRIFYKSKVSIKEIPRNNVSVLNQLNLKDSPTHGKKGARWTIIEWSDYLCTFCKQTYPFTRNILKNYKNQIYYVHKSFPLDEDSKEGKLALAISKCLWKSNPSTFFEMEPILYREAQSIARGEEKGFQNCSSKELDNSYYSKVDTDFNEAKKLGIMSIPTFWVNGRWIVGALDDTSWEKVLQDSRPQ
ncbi:MAG: thioredoxin domain-containing protein [Leptospira sp.]|nr:thioredoxin domain-containing protein [Leptospira sp.]